jgi:hypothetical protein
MGGTWTLSAGGAGGLRSAPGSARLSLASKGPGINPQKQAEHIEGTPQNINRVAQGKSTSTFLNPAEAEELTQQAWQNGQPVGGQGNMRTFDFGRPVGVGPNGGGFQTSVRVSMDGRGLIHGTPFGPIFEGPLP